ncbi:unnamed protein product [Lampetra planeri]
MVEPGEEAMRQLFKFYRRRRPPPDLGGVLDLREAARHPDTVYRARLEASGLDGEAQRVGLQPVSQWRAYGLNGYPGFIFIVNPFLPSGQRFWVRQCLKLYPQKPNVCNLDAHDPQRDDVWASGIRAGKGPREPRSLLEKLRWVTLGYHYNWNTKRYSAHHRSSLPVEVSGVAGILAAACGFPTFCAEAAILNFYRADSALGPHVDESELDLSQPLVSFSFGCSAVFLLGGLRREDPALPLFMHSGDVMVMSGESRLRYHAVPRILDSGGALPECLREPSYPREAAGDHAEPDPSGRGDPGVSATEPDAVSAADWEVCARYLRESRVNVTVRQVAAPGEAVPNTEPPLHQDAAAIVTQQGGYSDGDAHNHDEEGHRHSKEDTG